jgi:hypothetical protein
MKMLSNSRVTATLFCLSLVVITFCCKNSDEEFKSKETLDEQKIAVLAARSSEELTSEELEKDLKQYLELTTEGLELYYKLISEYDLNRANQINPGQRAENLRQTEQQVKNRSQILKMSSTIFGKSFNKLTAEEMDKLFTQRFDVSNNQSVGRTEATCTIREYPQLPAVPSTLGTVSWNAYNRVTMKGQTDCDWEFRFPARTPSAQFTASVIGTNTRTKTMLSFMSQLARRQANGNTYLLIGDQRLSLFVGLPQNVGLKILPSFQ